MTRYGGKHQAVRRRLEPYVVGSRCARCGRLIRSGEPWNLDHRDDGSGYLGPSHAKCNSRAGGQLGGVRRRARRQKVKSMLKRCAIAIEVSEDRAHTSIAAAGDVDDAVVVELVAYLDGTAGVVAAVQTLKATRNVIAVAVDPRSHGSNLIRVLADARIKVVEPGARDVASAHGEFLDLLAAGRLRHAGDPRLDAAVRHGDQRPLGGGAAWERRGVKVDASPAVAAELAVWARGQKKILTQASVY